MTVNLKGWKGTGAVADMVGVARQNLDRWIRTGICGAEGVGWIWVETGGANKGSYLVSPEGVKLARAYWKRSPRHPAKTAP